jgi:hypothetical protein
MNNTLRKQLLETASAYCAAKSISLSTISHKIVNDGKVLPRLQEGRDIHTATFEKFMAWFAQHWHADKMPSGPYANFIAKPEAFSSDPGRTPR